MSIWNLSAAHAFNYIVLGLTLAWPVVKTLLWPWTIVHVYSSMIVPVAELAKSYIDYSRAGASSQISCTVDFLSVWTLCTPYSILHTPKPCWYCTFNYYQYGYKLYRVRNVQTDKKSTVSIKGSVTPWNVVEALSEIWNMKYKIRNFIRIFPFTVSVHFMYVYAYWFSVYLSTLTSSIPSFSPFLRTL